MDDFNLTDSAVINALPDRESIEKFEGEALAISQPIHSVGCTMPRPT